MLKESNFAVQVQEIVSPKYGIKAYLFEEKSNPIVSLSAVFKGAGYAGDVLGKLGSAKMAAALLGEGAGNLDGQSLKEEMENLAIGISFNAGKDDFEASLLSTKENLPRAAELMRLMLTEPRFEAADMARVKAQMSEILKRQKEHPANELNLAFLHELYGTHPYGRNPEGRAEDIRSLGKTDLQELIKERLTRQNVLVGIAGDISKTEAEQLLDEIFGTLPEKGKLNFIREADLVFDGRDIRINKNSNGQNITLKAAPGVSRNDDYFYPLFVANHILGGSGLSSKLSQEIREKRGLTYGVYSYLGMDDKAPLIMVGFSTTPDKYDQAEKLFEKEWQNFGVDGVSEAELEKAKNYLIASYNLRFASISNISEMLTAMQKYNLGLDFLQKRNDYVRQVELKHVNDAARKFFNKDKLVNVSIGSFENVTKE